MDAKVQNAKYKPQKLKKKKKKKNIDEYVIDEIVVKAGSELIWIALPLSNQHIEKFFQLTFKRTKKYICSSSRTFSVGCCK